MGKTLQMMVRKKIVTIFASCVIAVIWAPILGGENENISFRISIEKNTYLEGEPIVVVKQLTNTSNKKLIVAAPDDLFTQYSLQWVDGDVKKIPRLMFVRAALPKDYGEEVTPHGVLTSDYNLIETYAYGLPVGNYFLRVRYFVSERYYRCWQGEIWSNSVNFSVVSPEGEEKDAYQLYKQARDILNTHSTQNYPFARKNLDKILEKYPGSIYAKYALFLKGISYQRMQADGKQDFQHAIVEFEKFLEKYPDIPYFSEQALRYIAHEYYTLHKFGEAKSTFQKLPDSYYKQKWLKKLGVSSK